MIFLFWVFNSIFVEISSNYSLYLINRSYIFLSQRLAFIKTHRFDWLSKVRINFLINCFIGTLFGHWLYIFSFGLDIYSETSAFYWFFVLYYQFVGYSIKLRYCCIALQPFFDSVDFVTLQIYYEQITYQLHIPTFQKNKASRNMWKSSSAQTLCFNSNILFFSFF
jgi:hypothetical protein